MIFKLEKVIKSKINPHNNKDHSAANKVRFENIKRNKERRIKIIKSNPNLTQQQLADMCQCGSSTIQRDIQELKECGEL